MALISNITNSISSSLTTGVQNALLGWVNSLIGGFIHNWWFGILLIVAGLVCWKAGPTLIKILAFILIVAGGALTLSYFGVVTL